MIWRGPMVIERHPADAARRRMGRARHLVVDLPPGTGDAQLTMAQQVPLAGAVIVSTPQDIALHRRPQGAQHVPQGRRAGARHHREHELLRLPALRRAQRHLQPWRRAARGRASSACEFLGEVPLDMAIRETSDGGRPIVVAAARQPARQDLSRHRRAGLAQGPGRPAKARRRGSSSSSPRRAARPPPYSPPPAPPPARAIRACPGRSIPASPSRRRSSA